MIEGNSYYWPLIENQIRRKLRNHTFGMVRIDEKTGQPKPHWGWDFYAVPGTPCFAICDGRIFDVVGKRIDKTNFGLSVIFEFTHKERTLYAAYCHLSGCVVRIGQTVKAGQQLGMTGNSGNAKDMKGLDQHLHLEFRTGPKPIKGDAKSRVDPIEIFKVVPLEQKYFEVYPWGSK